MDDVLEFIKRRFPVNCNWMAGNCYYFAVILKARFPTGDIYYHVIDGHFVFLYRDIFYDWTGIVEDIDVSRLVAWDKFEEYDSLQQARIIAGCVL